MALLWPERDVASARRLLNLAVHVLRLEGTFLFRPLRDHPRFRALLRQMRLDE